MAEGRTDAGLIVPSGLEKTLRELNGDNKEFLKVKDQLKLESLTGAVDEKYLASIKVVRDGVAYWEPKGKETHQDLSAMIMEELNYHLHRRVYQNMTAELYEQLKAVKDPTTGESYTSTITKIKFRVDANAIKQAFDENGATSAIVKGMTVNLGNQWYQREVGEVIHRKYGDDPVKYRNGIENIRVAIPELGREFAPEKLAPLGVDKLLEIYVKLIGDATEKQRS